MNGNRMTALEVRWLGPALVLVLAALSSAGPARPKTSSGPGSVAGSPADQAAAAATPGSAQRLREGTKILDEVGTFEVLGARATFHSLDGKYHLIGLENLNLERIVKRSRDAAQPPVWSVRGTVTEYLGSNYLLISRAILRNQQLGDRQR